MDMYFRVSSFSSLQCEYSWFIFNCSQVDFVWWDEANNRLILGLIYQNRQKMLVVASGQIIQLHQARNLVGRLYNITHFQVDEDTNDYLRYEGYAFIRSQYVIKINPNTQFIFLGPCIERLFPTHPWVSSIEALARNERQKNMIDVVGKIVGGGRYDRRNYVCEMIFQDRSAM